MKKLLFFTCASFASIQALGAQPNFFLSLNGGPSESLNQVETGTLFLPGNAATGTTGTPYATVTFGDVNNDNIPDLMAALTTNIQGIAPPLEIKVSAIEPNGKVDGSVTLTNAWIYRVNFPSTAQAHAGLGLEITLAGDFPGQGQLTQERRHRDVPTMSDLTAEITGIVLPPNTGVNGVTLTYAAPSAPVDGSHDRESSRPSVSELAFSKPIDDNDGFSDWMQATMTNPAGDPRVCLLHYTTLSGNVWTLSLTLGLRSVSQSATEAKKKGHADEIEVNSWQFGVSRPH